MSQKKKITEKDLVIRIDSKEDNWLGHIEIAHSPSEKYELIHARVKDTEGRLLKNLRKKDLLSKSDLSYGTFYQDGLVEEFDLYWNEYPFIIEYSYRIIEEEFLFVTTWHPLLYDRVNTLNSSLVIEAPLDYDMKMDFSDEFQFAEEIQEDSRTLQWKIGEYESTPPELYSRPLDESIAHVYVVPIEFDYGVHGSTSSWESFGNWLADLNVGTGRLLVSEEVIVDNLIMGASTPREKVEILYSYLQDKTKYINVDIDVGGLRSYPATYVCERKYGDCKALTTYMKAMLTYAEIKSYYTIVNSGSNTARININLPSQQFNHVILMVPIGEDTIWLENTSNTLPCDYLGTFTQGKYVLMVDSVDSKLIRTPQLMLADVLVRNHYEFRVDDEQQWQVSISKKLKGKSFEGYRYFKDQGSEKDLKERIIADVDVSNFQLAEWKVEESNRASRSIEVSVQGECGPQIREIANLHVVNPLRIVIPEFEEPEDRKQNVRINLPLNLSDSIVYILPFISGQEIEFPKDVVIISEFGEYVAVFTRGERSLHVMESFKLYRGDYSIGEYSEFFAFIDSIHTYQKRAAILLK